MNGKVPDNQPQTQKRKKKSRLPEKSFVLENGEYTFTGSVFVCEDDAVRRRVSVFLGVLFAISATALVAGGIVPCGAMMNTFYVIIPYVAEIGLFGYCVYCYIKFVSGGAKVRDYALKSGYLRIRPMSVAVFCVSALRLVAQSVYYSVNGIGSDEKPIFVFVSAALNAVCIGASVVIFLRCRDVEWKKENKSLIPKEDK